MARGSSRRAVQNITFLLFVCQALTESPEITSINTTKITAQNNEGYNEFLLDLQGTNLQSNKTKIRITSKDAAKNEICEKEDSKINEYELSELWRTNGANSTLQYKLRLPISVCGNVYLCLLHEVVGKSAIPPGMYTKTEQWYHQGTDIVIKVPTNEKCIEKE